MKYIKLFEELNPNTYIKAGEKMILKNQKKRGSILRNYGEELKYGKKTEVEIPKEYVYKIFSEENGGILHCKFKEYRCLFGGVSEEEQSFESVMSEDYNLFYLIVPVFEDMQDNIVIPFEILVYLYTVNKSKKNSGVKSRHLNLDINLEYTQSDADYQSGIFADRRSANMFIRDVLSKVFNDSDNFRVQDVVSFLDKPSEDLEKIYGLLNRIDVHYLYSDVLDTIGNRTISILKKPA